MRIRETELYEPVVRYLEVQGYSVHGEVGNLDVVARKPDGTDTFVAVELKTRMSLDLLGQAVRRKEVTDSVYVAVPVFGSRGRLRNGRNIRALLRRLEVGLLLVRFLKTGVRVEPILHPVPFSPRRFHRRQAAILREVEGRYIHEDKGGAPATTRKLTAFRQRSLLTAELLQRAGTASPRQLREAGAPQECGRILSQNVYGWFERVSRGVYRLHSAGEEVLQRETSTVEAILDATRRREDKTNARNRIDELP